MKMDPSTTSPDEGGVVEDSPPHLKRPRFLRRRETASIFRPGGVASAPIRCESESSIASSNCPPTRRGVQRRSGFYHNQLLRGAVLTTIALQQEKGGNIVPVVSPGSPILRGERRRKLEETAPTIEEKTEEKTDIDEDDEDTLSDDMPSVGQEDNDDDGDSSSNSDPDNEDVSINRLERKESEKTCPSEDDNSR